MDSSGAGGSGGSISIKAANIFNGGRLLAMGGNAFGLGGPGGGGRIALSTAGILQEGDTNASGGKSLGLSPSTHRASDLIGYWKFDENASLSVAADSSGNELNGTIGGSPQRLAGVRGGAFYFDGSDDRFSFPTIPRWPWTNIRFPFGFIPSAISAIPGPAFSVCRKELRHLAGEFQSRSSPFIHHRYAEGANTNQGPGNHNLPGWNQWYHVVCSNGGVGSVARTFVNGSYLEGNAVREIRVVENLPVNTSAPLNIGVNPEAAGSNGQHFQGRMDDVGLYGIALGIEDVQLIYKGEAHMSSLQNSAAHGTVHKATTPTLPVFADLNLTYGQKIIGLDLGEQPGLTYALTGLPSGLSNRKTFVPNDIPGILAWYAADRNGSFDYYPDKNYDRNDSFFTGDLVLGLSFDESNGSLAYDSTGNANHANLLNPGQWSAGKSGLAFPLMGTTTESSFPKSVS